MAIDITPRRSQYSREPRILPVQSNVPLPYAVGLPTKYTAFRPGQWEYADAVLNSPKRFRALQLPVGSGKTVIEMLCALMNPGRSAILTATRTLSDQLGTDMESTGLVDIRGLNNYLCLAFLDGGEWQDVSDPSRPLTMSCDDGPCMFGQKCSLLHGGCLYFDKVREAKSAKVVSTNYSYYMHQLEKHSIGKFDYLFCDEAHDAVDQITKHLQVELSRYEVESCGLNWLTEESGDLERWRSWAAQVVGHVQRRYQRRQEEMAQMPGRRVMRELRVLRRLVQKLTTIAHAQDWITWMQHNGTVVFAPVWPRAHTESVLFDRIPNVVLVSATLTPKTLEILNIPEEDYDYFEAASRFPVENRPVYWIKTAFIKNKTDESVLRWWVAQIDQIADMWPDEKGIIHTTSYEYMRYIYAHSRHQARLMVHTRETAKRVVADFKNTREPRILVSPSVNTGHDFYGDLARWQVISKVPFPDSKDPLTVARMEEDKDFGMHLASQKLLQTSGRVVRGEDDWGVTYIVDDNIGWFIRKYNRYFPYWYIEGFEGPLNVIPPRRW